MPFYNIPKYNGIHILLQQLVPDPNILPLYIRETTLVQISSHGITQ